VGGSIGHKYAGARGGSYTIAPASAAQRENYWHFSTCHIAVILIRPTFTTPPSLVARLELLILSQKKRAANEPLRNFTIDSYSRPTLMIFSSATQFAILRLLTLGFTPPVQNTVLIGGLPFDCESSDFAKFRFQLQERMNIY